MKIGDTYREWVSSARRALLFIKPATDVIAPLALIFFAYTTERIYEKQTEIQQVQADIQKSLITPNWEVRYERDSASESRKDDLIRITNTGSSAFNMRASATPIIQVALCGGRGDVLWDRFSVESDLELAELVASTQIANVSKREEIISLKRHLREFDDAMRGNELVSGKYLVNISHEFLVTLRYGDRLGGQVTKSYIASTEGVYEVKVDRPDRRLRLNEGNLRNVIEEIRTNKTNEQEHGWRGTLTCSGR